MIIMMQSGNGCIRDREYILIIEVSMGTVCIKGGNPLVGEVEIGRSEKCGTWYFGSGDYDR